MKLSKLALVAAIACGTYAGNVFADQTNDINLVSHCAAANCDCGEPVCGCEPVADGCCDKDCCDSGCDSCGCNSGCDSCGCNSGCGLGLFSCGDCCLGDPYTLFGEHCGWSAGGWMQLGYTSNALPAFNNYDDHLQLQQAWLYAEKAIDTSCGFDIGGRVDYLYGTDGPNTQAFGTDPRGWDNGWDHGGQYGFAMPQLYAEAGYGDLSVKAGHFYTIIGYEVVQATGNFFYSHAYTFNFSEPFTHTGLLATYNASDDVTLYGGYVMGWDSGFDDNGDAWLGGVSLGLTDDLTVTYASVAGRFSEAWSIGVETGYMQSVVANYAVSDSLNYVFQTDWLDTQTAAGTTARNTVDINQYLLKTINDCWGVGARFEWYQNEGIFTNAGATSDIYALTLGVNYRPHANVIVRPEIRWDWVENTTAIAAAGNSVLENNANNQTTFGIDTILTF